MPPSSGDRARARAAAAALDAGIYRAVRAPLLRNERAGKVLLAVIRAQNLWSLAGAGAVVFAGCHETRQAWVRANVRMTAGFAAAKLVSRVVARPRPDFPECAPARARRATARAFPARKCVVPIAFGASRAAPGRGSAAARRRAGRSTGPVQ